MTGPAAPSPATGVSPTIVGLLRGLAYAVLAAIASAAVAFAGGIDAESLGRNAWVIPVALAGARCLEGYVDKVRGQAPQVAAGGRPADPAAYVPAAAAVLEVAPPAAPTPLEDTAELVADAVAAAMPRAQAATVDRVTAAVLEALPAT